MQVEQRDYLILNDDKRKRFLAKVTNLDPHKAVVCDKDQKDRDRANYVEFSLEDVVCNLGKKPAYGDAYRVPIEYIRNSLEIEPWGSIKIYKDLSEEQFKKIIRSIKKTTRVLEEARVFPKEKPIHLDIKELKGLEGGHYKHYFNVKKDDELVIRATEFNEIDYYIYHELGHGVWYQLFDEGLRARWVKAFYKNISLIEDTETKVQKMRAELAKAGSVKAYKKELDDDDTKQLFTSVLDYLWDKYCIDVSDVNSLVADGEDLDDIWPTHSIPISKQEILVTEYAKKNPKELFSEAFAFFFDEGKILPKSMEKLVQKTLEACRYGKNSPGKKIEDDEE